jgi:ketosteroid isomerase-like protein
MENGNTTVTRNAYEAFGRGDIAAVMSAMAPDIELNVPQVLPQGGKARGHQEVGRFFERLAATWQDFGIDVEALVESGDRVLAIGRAHGKFGGVETGYGFVHSWTVRDGALARFDEYVDPAPELLARTVAG